MGKKSRAQRAQIRKQARSALKQNLKDYVSFNKNVVRGAANAALDRVVANKYKGVVRDAAGTVGNAVVGGIKAGINDPNRNALGKAFVNAWKSIFNDLKWYENYPELLSGITGANFCTDDSELFTYDSVGSSTLQSKGLIATHHVTLTNGSSFKARNMAFTKIFQSIRRANAGAVNYTEQQLNLYYSYVRTIIAMFATLRRAYGLTTRFTSINLAAPKLYLEACGLDYDDFKNNSADLRQYLNQTAEQLKVYVPLNLPILERTAWMFSNLFKDSDDAKAQMHAFVLYQFPVHNGTNMTLTNVAPGTPLTVAQYTALLDTQIAQLTSLTPASIISGDMIKAFGIEKVLDMPFTEENYKVEPAYSEEVLTQIQNLINPGNPSFSMNVDALGYDYVQVTGISVPGYNVSSGLPDTFVRDMNTPMINFYKNAVAPAELVGATRLTVTVGSPITDTSTNFSYYYGTEVVSITYVWKYAGNTLSYESCSTYKSALTAVSAMSSVKEWSHIDWMPRMNMDVTHYNSSGSQLYNSITDVWDFNNYATTSYKNLCQMHDLAYESLFFAPSLVKESANVTEIK